MDYRVARRFRTCRLRHDVSTGYFGDNYESSRSDTKDLVEGFYTLSHVFILMKVFICITRVIVMSSGSPADGNGVFA